MLDYAGLEALAAVLREGSFDRAARKLHVTPSAISQRIKLLEERVGQVLVMRGTPCTGTEAGRRLCLHVEQVALLENELRRANPELVPEGQVARPTLKLAVNADSLNSWFVDAMAAFTQGGNELLDISIDDQDHTAKRIKEGEVMAAVTASSSHITGCNIWPLANMHYVAAASPAFIARYFGDGITAHTLAQAPMLTYGRKDAMQDKWLQQQGVTARHMPPRHWVPSAARLHSRLRSRYRLGHAPHRAYPGPSQRWPVGGSCCQAPAFPAPLYWGPCAQRADGAGAADPSA